MFSWQYYNNIYNINIKIKRKNINQKERENKMKKNEKIIVASLVFALAITFIIRAIAIDCDLEGIKIFFGIQEPANKDFFFNWFAIGSVIWLMIGLLLIGYTKSKVVRICSMIPLGLYGILQFMAFFVTMAYGRFGYEDGYVVIDCIWYGFSTLLSFVPTLIIGFSFDRYWWLKLSNSRMVLHIESFFCKKSSKIWQTKYFCVQYYVL